MIVVLVYMCLCVLCVTDCVMLYGPLFVCLCLCV